MGATVGIPIPTQRRVGSILEAYPSSAGELHKLSVENHQEHQFESDYSSFKSSNTSSFKSSVSSKSSNSSVFFKERRRQSFKENIIRCELGDVNDLYKFEETKRGRRRSLGEGASGTVCVARRNYDNMEFAIKEISTSNLSAVQMKDLHTEIDVLKQFDHPNIAKLHKCYENPLRANLSLVLEIGNGGDLYSRLMDTVRFSEERAANIVYQMFLALDYVHKNNCIHRDIKLENWVFRDDETDDIMLVDFGLSCHIIGKEARFKTCVGTAYYMAPEVFRGEYDTACDVWSTGVIVFMLLSGTAPFGGANEDEISHNIIHSTHEYTSSCWRTISPECQDFIDRALTRNVSDRMTVKEALNHPWLQLQFQKSDYMIPKPIFENFVQFAQVSPFRKAMIRIIAYLAKYKQTKRLYNCFLSIDKQNIGNIAADDLWSALPSTIQDKLSDEELDFIITSIAMTKTREITMSDLVAAGLSKKIYLNKNCIFEAFEIFDEHNMGRIVLDDIETVLGSHLNPDFKEACLDEVKNNFEHIDTIGVTFEELHMYMNGTLCHS